MISLFDLMNGCFEGYGAFGAWLNVIKLRKDREIKGIVWQLMIGWWAWGIFNLFYYPHLDQWFSFSAGCVLVTGNAAWLITWLKILKIRARSLNVKSG